MTLADNIHTYHTIYTYQYHTYLSTHLPTNLPINRVKFRIWDKNRASCRGYSLLDGYVDMWVCGYVCMYICMYVRG